MLTNLQYALGVLSGGVVGFSLGLVGGGGSILAVPLMLYFVGETDPHVALGTSALAVAANAITTLVGHARKGLVNWRCGAVFAAAGIAGAFAGSSLGKAFDGQRLLALFACVMIIVGVMMLRSRSSSTASGLACEREHLPKVVGYGVSTGVFSGFFGIGGGFLIVPSLVASTGMPIINAIGTSLVAVSAFGLTTAFNYAMSGLIDLRLALAFIIGGLGGGLAGSLSARRLSSSGTLTSVFAILIFAVAGYILWHSLSGS